ncbi:ABC transporter permease [Nonomuraea ferruginea]|uniref:ABC transporter permease n=1 Tax=Nonomuraea ferruginea TaxID=46174 RepID=A0ABT4T7W1_9ACTN|nr:ABC transporter permease [Nonomuraea ferruginea]MDA0645520.1 ABC transporter permease [Nonomuraea ferruginea]
MNRALHAEWTKLRTVAGTGPLLLLAVVLTVAVGAALAATLTCPWGRCAQDSVKLTFSGLQASQACVALLAVLAVGGEYGTGMIGTTLTAIPRRGRVLAAKAAVVAGLTAVAGTVAVLVSALAGRLILPGRGYPALSLADGPTLRAAAGSVLYLALVALLGVGIAMAVRDPAASIAVVLGLLYLFPLLAHMVSDPGWHRVLWSLAPMNAGLAVQTTVNVASLPIPPWAGLGVLAAWSATALLAGGLLLRARDAS